MPLFARIQCSPPSAVLRRVRPRRSARLLSAARLGAAPSRRAANGLPPPRLASMLDPSGGVLKPLASMLACGFSSSNPARRQTASRFRPALPYPQLSSLPIAPTPAVRASCHSSPRHPCLEKAPLAAPRKCAKPRDNRTPMHTRTPDPRSTTEPPPLDHPSPHCYKPLRHSGFRPRR